MSKYNFPIKTGAELVDEVKGVFPELNFTEEDIKHPKADRMKAFYMAVLEHIIGITQDQLLANQLSIDGSFQQEYPELHEESNYMFTLTLVLKKVMEVAGVDDFLFTDVTAPAQGKRTARNMSALLNFVLFCRERHDIFKSIKDQNRGELEQCQMLIKDNETLQKEIEDIQMTQAEQEAEAAELENKYTDLKALLDQRHEVVTGKKTSINNHKHNIAEKKSRIAQLKVQLAQAKEDGAKLASKIVQSPERKRKEMDRMAKQLEELQMTGNQRRAHLLELQRNSDDSELVSQEIEQGLKLLRQIKSLMDSYRSVQAEVGTMHEEMEELQDRHKNLNKEEQQLKRVIQLKLEKKAKLKMQMENKISNKEEERQMIKQELDTLKQHGSAEANQVIVINNEIHKLTEEDKVNEQQYNNSTAQLSAKYAELLANLEDYNLKLAKSWQDEKERLL